MKKDMDTFFHFCIFTSIIENMVSKGKKLTMQSRSQFFVFSFDKYIEFLLVNNKCNKTIIFCLKLILYDNY